MIRVLVVEDNENFAQPVIEFLEQNKYDVSYCRQSDEAKRMLLDYPTDFILIDLMLPPSYRVEGLELLRYVKSHFKLVHPFMMSTKNEYVAQIVADAMRSGAVDWLTKESDEGPPSDAFKERLALRLKEVRIQMTQNIFVSHGHNELLMLKLKDFIVTRLEKKPIILSQQPSKGLTVVEKLEKVSEVCCFAIILMTKDDEQINGGIRPRQNVIHEIGFCQGKYGRSRVVLLAEKGVELFTNISGIVRIDFEPDHFDSVFDMLRLEIEEAFSH